MTTDSALVAIGKHYGLEPLEVAALLEAAARTKRNREELCRLARMILLPSAPLSGSVRMDYHQGAICDIHYNLTGASFEMMVGGGR